MCGRNRVFSLGALLVSVLAATYAFANNRPVSPQVGVFTHQLLRPFDNFDYLMLEHGEEPPDGWETGAGSFEQGTSPFFRVNVDPDDPNQNNCPLTTTAAGAADLNPTDWRVNTELLLRRSITIPRGAQHVRILITIDNDILDAFWNGQPLLTEKIRHDNCPVLDEWRIDVPQNLVDNNGSAILAIHVSDRGNETYFDARVLAELPTEEFNYLILDPNAGTFNNGALFKSAGNFASVLSDHGYLYQGPFSCPNGFPAGCGKWDPESPVGLTVDPLGMIYETNGLDLIIVDRLTGNRELLPVDCPGDGQFSDLEVEPATRRLFVTEQGTSLFEVDPATKSCRSVRSDLEGFDKSVTVNAEGDVLVGANDENEMAPFFLYVIDPKQAAGATLLPLFPLCGDLNVDEVLRDLATTDSGNTLILSNQRLFWLAASRTRCKVVSDFTDEEDGQTAEDLRSVATRGSRTLVTGITGSPVPFSSGIIAVFSLTADVLAGERIPDNREVLVDLGEDIFSSSVLVAIPPVPARVDGADVLVQKVEERFDAMPVLNGPAGTRTVLLSLTNNSTDTLFVVNYKVIDLSRGAIVLSVDGAPTGEGATLSEQRQILPGQTVKVDFKIGVSSSDPLVFRVSVFANRSQSKP